MPSATLANTLVAALLLLILGHAVMADDKRLVVLAKADATQLSNLACVQTYGVPSQRIKAWKKSGDSSAAVEARVECKPHAMFKGLPVYGAALCERKERWSCAKAVAHMPMTIEGYKLRVALGDFSPEIAHPLMQKALAARRFRSALNTKESHCTLSKGAFSELINIDCDGHQLVMSTWCPQSDCPRIYAIDGVHMSKE